MSPRCCTVGRTGRVKPEAPRLGLTHPLSNCRSDRARWITALTHGERQGQGPTNKGGKRLLHAEQGSTLSRIRVGACTHPALSQGLPLLCGESKLPRAQGLELTEATVPIDLSPRLQPCPLEAGSPFAGAGALALKAGAACPVASGGKQPCVRGPSGPTETGLRGMR